MSEVIYYLRDIDTNVVEAWRHAFAVIDTVQVSDRRGKKTAAGVSRFLRPISWEGFYFIRSECLDEIAPAAFH